MPPRRVEPLRDPIHLVVDGARVPAREGEPIAMAIVASGRLVLGRSVKYHRPRGAACFVGRCDGCLMRVDGVQSVMTCRAPARDGAIVETQNVLGSARRDLLAATDWFFPHGMNHHEMFTWNEQVNRMMQKVARRIAGIGTLPDDVLEPRESEEIEVDVLVVGAGPAGLTVARECASRHLRTMLVDEEDAPGGSLRWWPGALVGERAIDLADRLASEATQAGVRMHLRSSAVGVYEPWEDARGAGDPPSAAPVQRSARPVVAIETPRELARVRPRRLVIATGRHEGASAFEGADKPGVINFAGACWLLARGIVIGERVLLVGEGRGVDALASALRDARVEIVGPVPHDSVLRVRGRPSVSSAELERDGRTTREECDAVIVAPPTSAVFELAAQAGVRVTWSGSGYELEADARDGRTAADDVRVIGWASNVGALGDALAQAERAAQAIATELAG